MGNRNEVRMQESKYQVLNWKFWKSMKATLEATKKDLTDDRRAISYSLEMPGTGHATVIQRYNKLLEDIKVYDDHIHFYDVVIKRLESCIATLLNQEQREVIIIYANHPNKGDSSKREQEALKSGFSRSKFYEIANESFNILDEVLDIKAVKTKALD